MSEPVTRALTFSLLQSWRKFMDQSKEKATAWVAWFPVTTGRGWVYAALRSDGAVARMRIGVPVCDTDTKMCSP